MSAWIRFNDTDYLIKITELTADRVYIEYADGCQEWLSIDDFNRLSKAYQDYHNDK